MSNVRVSYKNIIEEYNKKSYWHKADEFAGIFILLRIQFVNLVTYIVMITSLIKDLRKTAKNLLNKKG